MKYNCEVAIMTLLIFLFIIDVEEKKGQRRDWEEAIAMMSYLIFFFKEITK